jgi:tetratricopeptide (TPR) repeat protein
MKPEDAQRDRQALELFSRALELADPRARAEFLQQACGADPVLRARVQALLANHREDGFLQQPSTALTQFPTAVTPAAEKIGDTIGRYKLLQQIGEGGCGVVYMAEQSEPLRRMVALKVIKLGMDTKSVIARFEAERQALAIMEHPNIAKVLDAGATATGRPYFVMELVRGVRLTDYSDQHRLGTIERLKLFLQVCAAVQHAHQKGIIHRDLKPSNILVTIHDGVPVPKVIDFGIAKATTDQRLTDKTLFTAYEQFLGTPAYMSPEQAEMSGLDIDTRTDLYSLGVLLYELLTGQTPFSAEELMRAGLEEMRRTIREKEPVKPSTRLNTMLISDAVELARRRGEPREQLAAVMRGDLDWIVMKCLEKDRTRRYDTANELARELHRYLNNEPVYARPPSAVYRLHKLARRHKLAVASAAAVGIALLVGVVATGWQAIRATRAERLEKEQRQQAERNATLARLEADKSQQVADFLREMLRGVRPTVALGRDVTVLREILDRATARLEANLAAQPAVQMTLLSTIGRTYRELGEYAKAELLLNKALGLRRQFPGESNLEEASLMHELGEVFRVCNRLDEAETKHRQALAMRERALGSENENVAASLQLLAKTLCERSQFQEAEALLHRGLDIEKKLHGPKHYDVVSCLHVLGSTLRQAGKLPDAERTYEEALALSQELTDVDTLKPILLQELASLRAAQKRPVEGLEFIRKALPLYQKLLQSNNVNPEITARFERAIKALSVQGPEIQLPQMEEAMTNLLAVQRQLIGDQNPSFAVSLQVIGTTLQLQGKHAEAEEYYRQGLEIQRRLWGDNHPLVAGNMANLASALTEQSRLAEAEPVLQQRLDICRRLYAKEPSKLDVPLLELADVIYRQGQYRRAEPLYRELIKLRADHPTAGGPSKEDAMASLGRFLADWAWAERQTPPALEQARQAELLLRECLAARLNATNVTRAKLGDTKSRLGGALLSVAICTPQPGPELLASRLTESESLLLAGHELIQSDPTAVPRSVRESLQRLIRLYEAWESTTPNAGSSAKAIAWRQRLETFEKAQLTAKRF